MANLKLISIIIPVYNEAQQIAVLIGKIEEFNARYANHQFAFQYIFVDDGSSDNSFGILKASVKGLKNYKIIKLSRNFGSHGAIRAGTVQADGDYVTIIPADLQIPLDEIPALFLKAESGFDVVWVVRESPDIGYIEKVFSNLYSGLMKKYVNTSFPKEGLETLIFNTKVKKLFNANMEDNSSFALQIMSYGFTFDFVRIKKLARKVGKSKWTIHKKIKLMIDSFVAFSFAPIRLVSLVGIIFFLVGCIWSGYIIFRKLVYNDLSSGWPAMYSTLLLGFGITNISLGILAEYLWRTLDAARRRPVFIIDEIVQETKE